MKISIVGYGWLGESVAQLLIEQGHQVVASTTSVDKTKMMESAGVVAEVIEFPLPGCNNQNYALFQAQLLIIMIPPKLRAGKSDYPEKVAQIIQLATAGDVRDIILISTSAVYAGLEGVVNEEDSIVETDEKVKLIAQAERLVLNFSAQSKVIRAAGLIDKQRHPGRFFINGRILKQPQEPVNLVHKTDISNIVALLSVATTESKIFNVASNTHVSKEIFYSLATTCYNNETINIEASHEHIANRIITSEKVRTELNYQFVYDDLVEWLKRGTNEAI